MMENKPQKPSIGRILWTDYPAFYSALILFVVWIIYLAWVPAWRADGPVISPSFAPVYLVIAIVLTVIALVILVRRTWLIWSVFRDGVQARGTIRSVSIRRDHGRVEYVYIFDREEVQSGASIHRNKQTLALKTGERVILMVDRNNPKHAFIRDLYV